MDMLFKSIQGGVKDVDLSKRMVKVAIAAFGNKDSYGDIIEHGAFTKTVAENGPQGKGRIRHFKNHDFYLAVGEPQELYEEGDHLIMVSKVASTTLGKDTLIEYQEGLIKEHSIGYGVVKSEDETDEDGRPTAKRLKEIMLWEGSSLTGWGANPNTPFIGVKALSDRMDKLEKLLTAPGFSDERYKAMEATLTELKEVMTALKQGFEPPKALDPKPEPLALSLKQVLEAIRKN
jgi:HK97 family phage prohead protease